MTDNWDGWIGRADRGEDVLTPAAIAAFAATLDWDQPPAGSGEAPQGAHWLLATPRPPMRNLGTDGHGERGAFLPPIELPRRMWAASALQFHRPLRIGEPVERVSTIAAVARKEGKTGPLVFVEIDHVFHAGGEVAVRDRQSLVYRDIQPTVLPPPAQTPAHMRDFGRTVATGPALLFRYSALTFNSHRIHYDHPYATEVELYPGLLVQGTLTATLLLDLCRRELGDNRLATFAFRAVAPAIVGEAIALSGRRTPDGLALQADAGGRTVMTATATLR